MSSIQREPSVVAAGTSAAIDAHLLRQVRGSVFDRIDWRFCIIMLLSFCINGGIVLYLQSVKLPPTKTLTLEEIPERFAKLIVEKPLPKIDKKKPEQNLVKSTETVPSEVLNEAPVETDNATEQPKPVISEAAKAAAKKTVSARAERTEQRIRNVGVLGMLTGVGSTAKGPGVVDVLGAIGDKKQSNFDLDKALANMSGLSKAQNVEALKQTVVKSKDVAVSNKQSIDDLIAGMSSAPSGSLAKKGDFIIQKPESIEGAASSDARRDNNAVNAVVQSHKASIRMSYEKFLKSNPTLEGKVTIRFSILASGAVGSVDVLENSTGDNDLVAEIVRKIKMWRFEPIGDGDVSVTYPFVFRPG